MKNIFEGLSLFQRIAYPRHKDLFERLAKNQTPQAVFITCSDSRVLPNLLLQSEPGDLFIIRNAGNIVPPSGSAYGGTTASLEYAIVALGIRDVVLCGHSNCGAMKGIMNPGNLDRMPAVKQWVSYAEPARRAALESHPKDASDDELLDAAVDYNVICQIRNILTFPFVRPLVEKGELELYGWVYDIATGHVKGLDTTGRHFVPLGDEMGSPDERHVLASVENDEEFWERL